jgi:pyruvate,water dikinase
MADGMLVPLAAADPATIGGKAASLQRLQAHGLPIPPTWVLPLDAWRAWRDGRPPEFDSPAPLVAVRSSAVAEDGRAHSFAGQYASVLGVTPDRLRAAVEEVWASFSSERAVAYRARAGIDSPGIAVVVQAMVDARASGVLFTINPLTGSWRELAVEAVWGLGERLVGGEAVPDRYLVTRPRRTPRPVQRVLARVRLRVGEVTVAEQRTELACGPRGLVERPTEAPRARKLADPDLLALCRLGLRCESLGAGPQDVEWALDRAGRPWLLQSRPITRPARLPRGGATLWTRRFVGERWPEGCTPLGWSIIAPILAWFIDYPDVSARFLGGDPPLRVVRGHPYFNVTVFRHLAFKFPGGPPPQFMLEFFPPEEQRAWLHRRAAPPDWRVYGAILATTFREQRWRRFRWNPFLNHLAWDEYLAGLDARLVGLEATRAAHALDVTTPIVRDYVKVHITSLLFANLWYQIVAPHVPADALAAPEGTITRQVNRELAELAERPEQLAGFLARHGHRSNASWEVFAPRWSEDPAAVLQLARTIRPALPAPVVDVDATPRVRWALDLARTYLRLREEQRYHLDRVLAILKRKLLELATPWFDDPADVRFLTVEELGLDIVEKRAIVARRSRELPEPDPPDFILGDEPAPPPTLHADRLQGLGISPGLVRGRTRVLRSPGEGDRLRPGEILVARATDPGWTPLFSVAGGLVLELGSLLSHGAVVAREYRLPGVANVQAATKVLVDGTEVTIDGRAGVVWVHR